ncbi:MAG: ribonuclease P protein component [Anaerotignaceae bacterium]
MQFTQSLKKNYQFGFVYNKGKSIANKYLVVYLIKNRKYTTTNRLGITVSKKVGKSVVRSRVTRLIKESYRLMENDLKQGFDIVVIARVSANGAAYKDINKALFSLLKKHNLFIETCKLPNESQVTINK